jgi:6-phosphogluconolactonase
VSRPTPDVVVEPDAEHLARAAAAALVARLAAAQAVHGSAAVVLTGGGIGIAVLEQVAALAAQPVR